MNDKTGTVQMGGNDQTGNQQQMEVSGVSPRPTAGIAPNSPSFFPESVRNRPNFDQLQAPRSTGSQTEDRGYRVNTKTRR